jgi:predicted ATPase
MGNITDKVA